MKRRRAVALAAALALLMPAQGYVEKGLAMGGTVTTLGWEWRNGRAIGQRATAQVLSVRKARRGLFGLGNAPSLGGSLPDPMTVELGIRETTGAGPAEPGRTLRLTMPLRELGEIASGDLVGIGIIADAVVCISAAPAGTDESALMDWFRTAPCDS